MSRKFLFGLPFSAFKKRLNDFGVNYSTSAIKNWEKRGLIEFDYTIGGWRYFKDEDALERSVARVKQMIEEHKKGRRFF